MSRPSVVEANDLESLEGLSGLVADVQLAVGLLSIRMRQILRRAQGDERLIAVVRPASVELARIADDADDMHELMRGLLERHQAKRADRNRGQL
jgi:hypothetical protein